MQWKPVAVVLPCALALTWAGLSVRPADAENEAPAATAAATEPKSLIGKAAPAFSLPDQHDKLRSLSEDKGKWVVLAFYPADMTRGCTLQNKSYSDNKDKFTPLNAVVYTVSTQNSASKREFCAKEGLEHTLLSDDGGKVAAAYNVLPAGGKVAKRVTFYIAPDGNVAAVDTQPKVLSAAEDSIAMLTKLASADSKAGDGSVKPAKEARVAMKELVPDFSLTDTVSGKEMALTTLSSGKKATAIIFVSTDCPVSNAYNKKMADLANTYGAKNVAFVGINANSTEPVSKIAEHAKKNGLPFPVLKDPDNAIADRFNAKVTPEVYVLNEQGILVYHGNITPQDKMDKDNLGLVLTQLVEGKPVAVEAMQEIRAHGCGIKRARK